MTLTEYQAHVWSLQGAASEIAGRGGEALHMTLFAFLNGNMLWREIYDSEVEMDARSDS